MAIEITDATFEEVVLKSDKPVVVDFWAEWCGPCKMLGPTIEELSKDFEGQVVVGKVDVDANQDFASQYGVRNIPTVLIFQNGEVVGRQVGVAPKQTYADALNQLVKQIIASKKIIEKRTLKKKFAFFILLNLLNKNDLKKKVKKS